MLKKFAATGVVVAAATGAMMFSSPAYADDAVTSGNGSVMGGIQTITPVLVPVATCGNATPTVGIAQAGCKDIGNVGGHH